MGSSTAIFIKQIKDIFKNKGVLVQFIVFPGMAFVMTKLLDVNLDGLSDTFFISTFASMFIGMSLISIIAVAIAEDREKKSLRFLMMAGVKPRQYLIGVGGVFLTLALAVGIIFTIMMTELSHLEKLTMLTSMMLAAIASILFGAIIGMISKNEQSAVSLGMAAGMFMGFTPMIGAFNENIRRIISVLYTSNFIYYDFYTVDITRRFMVILMNIALLAIVFTWIYKKQNFST